MFSRFVSFLLIKFVSAQFGEFFWLSDDFTGSHRETQPSHKHEDYRAIDPDARVLFRENNLYNLEVNEDDPQKHDIITWTNDEKLGVGREIDIMSDNTLQEHSSNDKLVNKFPEDIFLWADTVTTISYKATTEKKQRTEKYKGLNIKERLLGSSCTYMERTECEAKKGFADNMANTNNKTVLADPLICCVLSHKNKTEDNVWNVYLPANMHMGRYKRSEDIAQKQRNILLKRKYTRPHRKPSRNNPPRPKTTEPDYESDTDDPYWNVKNKPTYLQNQDTYTRYETDSEEDGDDYIVEVPKPITNAYSNNLRPIEWTISQGNKGSSYSESEEYDDRLDDIYGVSTIDPRKVYTPRIDRRRKTNLHVKPFQPLTTEEIPDDGDIPTTSYQNYPEYSAPEDFKMLNFLKKNKYVISNVARTSTTESFSNSDHQEANESSESVQESVNDDFLENQVFKTCGKSATVINIDKQISETQNGSHPWLALVVPTRKLNNLLCYASLIHPRAALSAADCVHRSVPREVTLIVGLWNLNERSRLKSRIVSVYIHPNYDGGLNYNLAILHWKRSLRLGINVQPVCIADPRKEYNCIFVGWGGFDQGIQSRSQWQRAKIHDCNHHLSLNGVGVPANAFCASVKASSTVTGFGGSLVCNVQGYFAAVGVAISRDSALVLLPIREWVTKAISILHKQ